MSTVPHTNEQTISDELCIILRTKVSRDQLPETKDTDAYEQAYYNMEKTVQRLVINPTTRFVMIELNEPASYQVVVNRFLRDLTFSACQQYGSTCFSVIYGSDCYRSTQEPSVPTK